MLFYLFKEFIDEVLDEDLIDHAMYYSIKYNNYEAEEKCINMKQIIKYIKMNTIGTLDSCGLRNNRQLCYLNSVFHFIFSAKISKTSFYSKVKQTWTKQIYFQSIHQRII